MASQHAERRSIRASYRRRDLRTALRRYLPRQELNACCGDSRVRWTEWLLVLCAVLMSFSSRGTLADRFSDTREILIDMHPGRRRPGKTYAGFISALTQVSDEVLLTVCKALRQVMQRIAGEAWKIHGYIVFGVDGSKIDVPMTRANEAGFGCSSRSKSGPQMMLTTIFHLGTGVPWAFMHGVAKAVERLHLREMLCLLPAGAMLVADAGFTGYELLSALAANGNPFIIRVGANVTLLKKLGWVTEIHDDIVCLWPVKQQKKTNPPLVLRLVRVIDSRNRVMHLLSNVLEPQQLSDATMIDLYKRRWGIELLYRSLKQTLSRRKMLSDSPANARVELDWALVSLWLLSLMQWEAIGLHQNPSFAAGLRAVRQAMAGQSRRSLQQALAAAVGDAYVRLGSKKARHWPHKKRDKPPGNPKARYATRTEVANAATLRTKRAAA